MKNEKGKMKPRLTTIEAWTGQQRFVKEGGEERYEPATLLFESYNWPQN